MSSERMGYNALVARLKKSGHTNELALVEEVWNAIKHHPIGDGGLHSFAAKLSDISDRIESDKQEQIMLDE